MSDTDSPSTVDQLTEKMVALLRSTMAEKAAAIITVGRDSEDGKHAVSAAFKLTFTASKVYVKLTLSHSAKDSCECEDSFDLDDPENPPLPGIVERRGRKGVEV